MAYDLTQVKILIVEDMQPMLSLTTSILGVFGFKNIHGARSGADGFDLFCQYNHDIVITDWQMEPMNGIELIAKIRKDDASPNKFVPIILMTGYSDQIRVESARDTGVTEFLMKPYSARDMYTRIVQIIEKPRQFVDTGLFFGPDRRRRKNFDFHSENRRGMSDKNTGDWGGSDPDLELVLRSLQNDVKKL